MAGIYDADFLRGFHLGKAYRANLLRAAKEEPVAYLFNGVRLPKLPEEIKSYPYLMVSRLTTGANASNLLVYGFATEPYTIKKSNFLQGEYDLNGVESGAYRGAVCYTSTEPDVWHVDNEAEGENMTNFPRIVWANYNIYASDGTLFLAASDPIPVYE